MLRLYFGFVSLALAQQGSIPANISERVGETLRYTQGQILVAAEAMPEGKYGFVPGGGEFGGVRSFAEQIKHVACATKRSSSRWRGRLRRSMARREGRAKRVRRLS